MSRETNIHFKCDGCGHDEVVRLETGVTVASQVTEMTQFRRDGDPGPPASVTSGFSTSGGQFAGYACGKCRRVMASSAQELHDYLRSRGMIGEYRSIG